MERFQREGIPAEAFERSKRALYGELVAALNSTGSIANGLVNMHLKGRSFSPISIPWRLCAWKMGKSACARFSSGSAACFPSSCPLKTHGLGPKEETLMTHHITFPHLGLEFTVNTVAFSIGGFSVYWYGIIIAVGFLLALVYASYSCKKMNIDVNRLFDVVIVGLIAGVVFARLFYVVFYPGDKYRENPMEIFQIHDGGLAIYGGLIGAVVFGGLMAKIRKMKVAAVLDIASLGFLIGQGIGRWGNFINQEAFGSATDLPWGMHSDNTALVVDGNVHPCFLYESLLCLLGFVLLHFFTRKLRRYDGQTFLLYIVWYGACRFFIEGLRTDSLIIPGTGLRVSQVIAAACVVAGIILLVVFRHKTSLTGCGDPHVMEAVGLVEAAEPQPEEEHIASTIFGDLPEEEVREIFSDPLEEKTAKEATQEKGEEPASQEESEAAARKRKPNNT